MFSYILYVLQLIFPLLNLLLGHAVARFVEALRYKPEVRGFDCFPIVALEFFIDIIPPAALWSWG